MPRNAPGNQIAAKPAAAKSAATRKRQATERAALRAANPPPLSPSPAIEPNPSPIIPQPVSDSYTRGELSRVRTQTKTMAKLLDVAMHDDEPDARRIESLTRALTQLRTQEQHLAGRPSPGAYRPEVPRIRRSLVEYPGGERRVQHSQTVRVSSIDVAPAPTPEPPAAPSAA